MTRADSDAAVDATVAALVPDVRPPAVRRRDAVLVTGPWLAGSSSVLAALADRLPDVRFVESDELGPGEVPIAVVFVVSAATPLTESDCAVLDLAAAHTDAVIGVVAKIDLHHNWRDVLEADRTVLAGHSTRYATMPWVGAAAAPDLGQPRCADLVDELSRTLADQALNRRNRLRAWQFRIESSIRQHDAAVHGAGREALVAGLQAERAEAGREARAVKSQRTIALRSQVQQARLQLSYFARNRCNSVRTELQEDAAQLNRRGLAQFLIYVERRVHAVIAEVDEGITAHLSSMAAELDLPLDRVTPAGIRPEIGQPALRARRLETRLMVLLGVAFGVGMALTLNAVLGRLFTDLAPGLAAVGGICCALIGVGAAVWMVRTRALLHDRAVLDRWIGDLSTRLRAALDQSVASRVLAAEMALTSVATQRTAADQQRVAGRIKAIDAELHQHAVARAQAGAARDRALPSLRTALAKVQAELEAARASAEVTETATDATSGFAHNGAADAASSSSREPGDGSREPVDGLANARLASN